MQNDFFNELKKLFEKLPGIGPRQASRFIWAMTDFTPQELGKLSELIALLDSRFNRCGLCLRVASSEALPGRQTSMAGSGFVCSFCKPNSQRDHTKIMVVERDGDLSNIEKSSAYNGLYHVLGGAVDPMKESQKAREGIKKLYARLEKTAGAEIEVILALSPTKLSEFTGNYIVKILEPVKPKITRLGRGLATGTELEYADEMTLRQALDNRK